MSQPTEPSPDLRDTDVIHRLDVLAPARVYDLLTAALFDLAPSGWEEQETPEGVRFSLHRETAAQADDVERSLRAALPDVDLQIDRFEVRNRDWATAWREYFTAVLCGEDFVVVAPWMVGPDQPFPGRIPLVIDPKQAFGTGHHPTTALCLEAISDLYQNGWLGRGMRFLDIGTGSGVLGLACAKLGMTGVGVDVDPLSIDNVEQNKRLNDVPDEAFAAAVGSVAPIGASEIADKATGVGSEFGNMDHVAGFAASADSLFAGDAVTTLVGEERFELVLANILAGPLVTMADAIVGRVKPGGTLVLSGLLTSQVEEVTTAYVSRGLGAPRVMTSGEWAALVFG